MEYANGSAGLVQAVLANTKVRHIKRDTKAVSQ